MRKRLQSATTCLLLWVVAPSVEARLPTGWTVHVFSGRIVEIEPAGGVLACATEGGLLFFDPQTQSFAQVADAGCTDRQCLSSNQLSSISRDGAGRYWLGTKAQGVVVFQPGSGGGQYSQFFSRNAVERGRILSDSVTCIEAAGDDAVYVGSRIGVAQIDLESGVQNYNPEADRRLGQDLRGEMVHDLAVDSVWVWVATDSGVARYDRTPPYDPQFLDTGLEGRVAFCVEILGDSIYAGTEVGLHVWREDEMRWRRLLDTGGPTPTFRVLSVARLTDGTLVVGSDVEVRWYGAGSWFVRSPGGRFLVQDRDFPTIVATGDTLWTSQGNIVGEGGFVDRWRPFVGWEGFEPAQIPARDVLSIDVGPTGSLWVGTRHGGLGRLPVAGTWCALNSNDADFAMCTGPFGSSVFGLLADRTGLVWFAELPLINQTRPLYQATPDPGCNHANTLCVQIQPGEQGFGGRYWRMREDGEGHRYFLSDGDGAGGGIDLLSADQMQVLNLRADRLGGNKIRAIAFDRERGPWQVAYLGIDNLSNQGLRTWRQSNDLFMPTTANFNTLFLPDSVIIEEYRDIVVDHRSNVPLLWVGTNQGLMEYDTVDLFQGILSEKTDVEPGLLSIDIKDLELDEFGSLWVATAKGLNRIDLASRDENPRSRFTIDAFTTIETIRELNAASPGIIGELYRTERTLAPLPSPIVNALAYDAGRNLLYAATEGGVFALDVLGIDRTETRSLDEAFVWPNPVRADAGHREVRLARVSEPATVTISNLEGQIVCELVQVEDGDVIWDLGTPSCLGSGEGRFEATSGIYMVRITTSVGSQIRSLVVIR